VENKNALKGSMSDNKFSAFNVKAGKVWTFPKKDARRIV
jgi:hypothetical protein